jgi:hypothetical protein
MACSKARVSAISVSRSPDLTVNTFNIFEFQPYYFNATSRRYLSMRETAHMTEDERRALCVGVAAGASSSQVLLGTAMELLTTEVRYQYDHAWLWGDGYRAHSRVVVCVL